MNLRWSGPLLFFLSSVGGWACTERKSTSVHLATHLNYLPPRNTLREKWKICTSEHFACFIIIYFEGEYLDIIESELRIQSFPKRWKGTTSKHAEFKFLHILLSVLGVLRGTPSKQRVPTLVYKVETRPFRCKTQFTLVKTTTTNGNPERIGAWRYWAIHFK